MTLKQKALWATVAFFATGVALVSYHALLRPDFFVRGHWEHFQAQVPLAAYAHFIFGPLALLIGSLQFLPRLRTSLPWLHRGVGWLYVFSCLTSAAGGLILALNSRSGLGVQIGFSLLALVWAYTTARALWLAATRRLVEHRAWMMRSYALTTAAITFRLGYLMLLPMTGLSFSFCYTLGALTCWPLNLLIAEWWLRRDRHPRPARLATAGNRP